MGTTCASLTRRLLLLLLALPLGGCLTLGGQDPGYDLMLRGGVVYDGAGGEPYRADVAILGGRIAAVGDLREARTLVALDVSGYVVVPGFIEQQAVPGKLDFDAADQGVTTLVVPPESIPNKVRRRGARLNLVATEVPSGDSVSPLAAFLDALEERDATRLAEVVRDLTHARARALGLVGRGLLMPGYAADLAVLDLGLNAHEEPPGPDSPAAALVVRHVCVNGVPVVRDGTPLPERPGRVLPTP